MIWKASKTTGGPAICHNLTILLVTSLITLIPMDLRGRYNGNIWTATCVNRDVFKMGNSQFSDIQSYLSILMYMYNYQSVSLWGHFSKSLCLRQGFMRVTLRNKKNTGLICFMLVSSSDFGLLCCTIYTLQLQGKNGQNKPENPQN